MFQNFGICWPQRRVNLSIKTKINRSTWSYRNDTYTVMNTNQVTNTNQQKHQHITKRKHDQSETRKSRHHREIHYCPNDKRIHILTSPSTYTKNYLGLDYASSTTTPIWLCPNKAAPLTIGSIWSTRPLTQQCKCNNILSSNTIRLRPQHMLHYH